MALSPTTAHRLARWSTVAAAVLVLGVFCAVALSKPYALEREIWLARATGYGALGALFLSLLVTPVRQLAGWWRRGRLATAPWHAFRRAFGLAAGGFGALHGGWVMGTYLWGSWRAVLEWPYLRSGLVSLALLGLLAFTSFPRLLGWLRVRLWKQLHRLAYVAAFFAFLHLFLAPFGPRGWVLGLFGALVAVRLLSFVAGFRSGPGDRPGSRVRTSSR